MSQVKGCHTHIYKSTDSSLNGFTVRQRLNASFVQNLGILDRLQILILHNLSHYIFHPEAMVFATPITNPSDFVGTNTWVCTLWNRRLFRIVTQNRKERHWLQLDVLIWF